MFERYAAHPREKGYLIKPASTTEGVFFHPKAIGVVIRYYIGLATLYPKIQETKKSASAKEGRRWRHDPERGRNPYMLSFKINVKASWVSGIDTLPFVPTLTFTIVFVPVTVQVNVAPLTFFPPRVVE